MYYYTYTKHFVMDLTCAWSQNFNH